jgi:hypothetical protein
MWVVKALCATAGSAPQARLGEEQVTKTLERIKQLASGELRIELVDALHWPFQRFCEWWLYETTVTVATM